MNVRVFFILISLAWLPATPCGYSAGTDTPPPKKVLILLAETPNFPSYELVVGGFRERISQHQSFAVNYSMEYLELTGNADNPAYHETLAGWLKTKYEKNRPEFILTAGVSAIPFLLKYGNMVFPGIPKIVVSGSAGKMKAEEVDGKFILLASEYDPGKNFEMILKLQADIKTIYVVIGDSDSERQMTKKLMAAAERFSKRVSIVFLNRLPFSEILETIQNADRHSAVFFHIYLRSADGQAFTPAEACKMVIDAAKISVYYSQDSTIHPGGLGGFLYSNKISGANAADIWLDMLSGKKETAIVLRPAEEYYFDWRVLKQLGIDESGLPPGSRVEFREPGLWDTYKWWLISGAVVFVLQGIGIAGLLFQKQRRQRAEAALENYRRHLEEIISERTAELRNKQESLKESEEKNRLILESAGDGIFGVNSEGKLHFINKSAGNMLGWKSEELIGKGIHEICHHTRADGSLYPFAECPMCTAYQNGIISHIDNEILWRKDGSWFNTEYTARPIYKNEKLAGAVITFQDITLRRKMEEQMIRAKEAAESANRAKSEFLANMSHELRTPLNAVIGFSQILAHGGNLTKEQQENLGIINRSGEHLLTLINTVLDMSKIEAGRTVLSENDFDLHCFLDDLKDIFRIRAAQKDLWLAFERTPDVPRFVRTDEAKLRQVLINLIGNALKFTKTGGITVKTDTTPSPDTQFTNLVFSVEDTGPGIAKEELCTVFEPFVQTETGRKSQEGTGLGLPISRKFVQMMGGDIAVRSEVSKGSVFRFHIRAGIPEMPGVPVCESPGRVIGTEPGQPCFRILIADDNADNRLLLASLLQPFGFDLREAENGKQAIDIWEEWRPHLIWMDIRMPVMDGCEAAKRIRDRESEIRNQNPDSTFLISGSTVIIAITASAFEEDRAKVLNAGCSDFLRKPFRVTEIFDLMHRHAGIRFVYAESAEPLNRENRMSAQSILTPQRLGAVPETLREELLTAAAMMSIDDTESAVRKIREHDRILADALDELLSEFHFEIIENALKEMGNQNSHE